MGYFIKIKSPKNIKESDVRSIIFNLPDYLKGPLNEVKEQAWGWHCICDVHKPEGKELKISGSYGMSGNNAQNFTNHIQHALDDMGYCTFLAYTEGVLFDEEISSEDKPAKLDTSKSNCSHCGADITDHTTRYCERCYQILIVKNSELQLQIKKRIPKEDVKIFMTELRNLIIKPQTDEYDANNKLKDISELYLKHIDKLGGIEYEENNDK